MPTPVSRRTALVATLLGGGALGGTSLAGCSLRPTPPAAAPAPTNPDRALLTALTQRIAALLPQAPAPWHAAHLAQLQALGSAHHSPTQGTAQRAADLTAERALHDALLAGAVGAHAPAFARLLTSLAAGQAQLLAGA